MRQRYTAGTISFKMTSVAAIVSSGQRRTPPYDRRLTDHLLCPRDNEIFLSAGGACRTPYSKLFTRALHAASPERANGPGSLALTEAEDTLAGRRLLFRLSRSHPVEADPDVAGREREPDVIPARPMPGPIPTPEPVPTSPVPGSKFLSIPPGMWLLPVPPGTCDRLRSARSRE